MLQYYSFWIHCVTFVGRSALLVAAVHIVSMIYHLFKNAQKIIPQKIKRGLKDGQRMSLKNVLKTFQKMVKGGNGHNGVSEQNWPFPNSVQRTPAPPTQHQPPQKSRLSQVSFFTVEVVFVFGLHRLTSVSCGKKALRLGHSSTQCFVYISTL